MNITSIEKEIKELFKDIGLDKFEINLVKSSIYPGQFSIHLHKILSYNHLVSNAYNEFIISTVAPIINDILESKNINKIRGEYKEIVSKLESDLLEANNKIQELESYKTHYELAYTLEHGKQAD